MASVMSTVLSRLNAFLDSELEQVLCFDSAIDAEKFASKKCATFLILPEEDQTKNFMAGLMIQNLSRELFAVADENGGKLKNRVVLFCDELGTMPPFDILPLFPAGRSRRLTLVPIICVSLLSAGVDIGYFRRTSHSRTSASGVDRTGT